MKPAWLRDATRWLIRRQMEQLMDIHDSRICGAFASGWNACTAHTTEAKARETDETGIVAVGSRQEHLARLRCASKRIH